MRAAADAGVTVLLDGQGADEIFGGYRTQVAWAVPELVRAGRVTDAARIIARLLLQDRLAGAAALSQPLLPPSLRDSLRARTKGGRGLRSEQLRDVAAARPATRVTSFDGLRRLLLTSRGLPELLRYEDRNSMDHSIEARVPFLDHRLVELALALPPATLVRGGVSKSVLRQAMAGIVPAPVLARKDKVGFETPGSGWFRGQLGELAADIFSSRSFRERDLVDPGAATGLLARHREGKGDASLLLWRALNLELWALQFLDAPAS
jgi:asparagine synthase (glutamine-hydrolysing)